MRYTTFIIFLGLNISVFSQSIKPKLVVGIVVDQMRHEYLQRFESKYGNDGFKRLQSQGFEARNHHYNYVPTYTAPGHASIYTGTTPRYHGIIANDWYSKELGRPTYCVADTTVTAVGGTERNGLISPRNLMVNTITDELKLATNFRAKVIGMSIKDRGAVLPAGHAAEAAYWFDSNTGEFMTSDFYVDELPDWVKDFNKKKLVDKYMKKDWTTLLPIDQYVESTPDNVPYERGFKGKDTPTFPYNLDKLRMKNGPYGMIRTTPFGNSILADFAKAAVEGENLGKDEITDFLAVSFSSTDYVGHNFGPNSVELEDTYLRLDQTLGELMKYLDEQIGKGEYVIFLTADHGVAANSQFLLDHKLPGGYIDMDEIKQIVAQGIMDLGLDPEKLILSSSNDQVFLNHDYIKTQGLDLEVTQQKVADVLMQIPQVAEVFNATDLANRDYTDPLRIIIQNGYNRKLSGDLLILNKPGYLYNNYGSAGTTHGTGYAYDTHVPMLFYGTGIKNGSTTQKTYITDLVPSLSMILNISIPNSAITGQPIEDLFDE